MSRLKGEKKNIDRMDLRIINALCERGRQSIAELSRAVGLSPNPCSARIARLESDGVILGYHADVDTESLTGCSLYFVTITLKSYSPETARRIESLIAADPHIVSADALFGAVDYLLQVYARSTQHYHDILAPLLAHEIDYQTWPVSRRVMRGRLHRLISRLTSGDL